MLDSEGHMVLTGSVEVKIVVRGRLRVRVRAGVRVIQVTPSTGCGRISARPDTTIEPSG
ncbi:MAG: hypothetical protein WCG37_04450 [Actinomycetes bacterium]